MVRVTDRLCMYQSSVILAVILSLFCPHAGDAPLDCDSTAKPGAKILVLPHHLAGNALASPTYLLIINAWLRLTQAARTCTRDSASRALPNSPTMYPTQQKTRERSTFKVCMNVPAGPYQSSSFFLGASRQSRTLNWRPTNSPSPPQQAYAC
jgi:hypothetical protein